jgi:RND family efflux transporter MFP subunit
MIIRETRRAAMGLLALALSALAVAACQRGGAADAKAEPAPNVTMVGTENIVLVRQTELAMGPGLSGTLGAEREATVRAEVGGRILETMVDEGSRVSTGTTLARIDDATVRDNFLSARSGVTTAQTAADIAKRELERSEKLAQAGAIAERELEMARRTDIAAQSQLADARARLTIAQKSLDDTRVKAPFDGVVSKRDVSAGDVVQPGGALFTVIDPTSMRVEGTIPAAELGSVRPGAPVTFSVNGYSEKFAGRVTRINPMADPTTGQVRLVVSIPNARTQLVAGLYAEGRIASAKRKGLTAPTSAVDLTAVRPFVVRIKDGKVEKIEVTLGLRDEDTEQVEIASGVAAGDTLLVGPARGITPGTAVRVSVPTDRASSRN